MSVLLFTIGSHGDVHPFVGIGTALRQRGHDVTLITNAHFESLAKAAGLEFAEMGSDEKFRELIQDPDLWHPRRAFDAVFMRGVIPTLEEGYNVIAKLNVPGQTVVVASILGFSARLAQEKLGIPTVSAHTAPAIIRSVYDPPKLPLLFMPWWMPYWMRRSMWGLIDRIVDSKITPPMNEVRKKLGLPPVPKGIMDEWWHSPQLVLGLWPEWFAPSQVDWPKQLEPVGFPLWDETGISDMSEELRNWLDTGTAPIAFTPGSAMIQGRLFFEESVGACLRMQRRGVLLTRHRDQLPRNLPASVKHVDYAPFGSLLPKCAALVHHGGIGTTAQALRAGVPQLIMPMAHDQFDNANRIKRLGVGDSINVSSYRSRKIARILSGLIDSEDVQTNCRETTMRFKGADALGKCADLIERFLPSTTPLNLR